MTPHEIDQVLRWLRDLGFRAEYNSKCHCIIIRLEGK